MIWIWNNLVSGTIVKLMEVGSSERKLCSWGRVHAWRGSWIPDPFPTLSWLPWCDEVSRHAL